MATVDPNLHRISLPGRNPILPDVYTCHNHPLVPPVKAMRIIHTWEKKQQIPSGSDAQLKALGLLQVPEDTLIFARDVYSTNPRDDALQAWLTPARLMDPTAKANLRHATDEAMGNKDNITLEPPVLKPDGTWTGGLAIERGCEPVKQNTRCYTIANSFQSQRGTWAPTQGSKVNGAFDEDNLLRRNLNIAVAPFPMTAMKQIPVETRNIIEEYTSMLNIPPLGLSGNTAHNTLQMNVAPALPYGSTQTLEGSLGFYGGNHNDNKDSPARFTNMTIQFHIPRLGIYFTLRNFDSANFCGLNYHGGTPPVAPRGVNLQKDAYCITFISYPPEKMGEGLGHVVIGAMPTAKDRVLKMSAEMQHIDCDSCINRTYVNDANFAADGQVVMDIRPHCVFIAHMFLLLLIFLSNQLPLVYDFRIDSDRLLSAFSFEVDGTRESVGPWVNGPG
ncbi:hypothetical protein B0H13DRAFT_2348154 [Mycena leptocephala]|nr:hypothetical protein B0H13DRAFT_2348154 [Mycena leptocephala]